MAVGFPAKTTYANGDVFSASDINDTNGTLNLVNPATLPKSVNALYNSSFDIWQRGTTFTGTSPFYGADRMIFARTAGAAGGTWTRQNSGLTGFLYSVRAQRDSGNTSTNGFRVAAQSLETEDSIRFAGKIVTFSFYAKVGANYSGGSTITGIILSGTGTDQQAYGGGFTGEATVVSTALSGVSTSWQRFSVTGTVASNATEIAVNVAFTPTGTAGANDWVEVTGYQLEEGSVATPYSTMTGTIQGELAACQRYYFRTQTGTGSGYFGVTVAGSSTTTYANVIMKQTMRTSPTSIDFSGLRWQAINAAANITNATISDATPENVILNCTTTGATTAAMNYFSGQSNTAFIGFSAEL
jgi:hypothetical protein